MEGSAQQLMEVLRPAMEAAGVDIGEGRLRPKINLDLPVSVMALQLGQCLKRCDVFRWTGGREVCTVGREGRLEWMTSERFPSWVEKHVCTYKARQHGDQMISMGKDLAGKLLASDQFLEEIPELDQVSRVRLPVREDDGQVRLLRPGYNAGCRVWCCDEVPVAEDMGLAAAMRAIEVLCEGFPFADDTAAPGRGLWGNRSFLVHVSGMLGFFLRLMVEPGTQRPVLVYVANAQGSGKSLLAAMALAPTFGLPAAADVPMGAKNAVNQEKLTALLETTARTMAPYLWLDDAPGSIFSNSLNRFATAPMHTGRCYGTNAESFTVPNVTQVVVTGNNVELARDMMQRSLICELFLPVDAEGREFERDITPTWLAAAGQRGAVLSACWAMVRHFLESGEQTGPWLKRRASAWSGLVGGVLAAAGVTGNPFADPKLPMAGDQTGEEMRAVLVAVAEGFEADEAFGMVEQVMDLKKFVNEARARGLLMWLVGADGEKDLPGDKLKRVGTALKPWRGREDLATTSGRRFRFGRRRQESGSVYPVEWLD